MTTCNWNYSNFFNLLIIPSGATPPRKLRKPGRLKSYVRYVRSKRTVARLRETERTATSDVTRVKNKEGMEPVTDRSQSRGSSSFFQLGIVDLL